MSHPLEVSREGSPRFGFIWAALSLVALHLCLGLLVPYVMFITPAAWITMYALATAMTLLEAREVPARTRWRWRLVALHFLLAIGSFLSILYVEYLSHQSSGAVWLNGLLRSYRTLPLLLAVCTPEEEDRRVNRALDILQIALIAVIFFALFTPNLQLSLQGVIAQLPADLVNRYSYSVSTILALLAFIAVFTAKTADSRMFHGVIALYLSISVPASIWTNQVLIRTWGVPPSSVLFVVGDLSLLAYIAAVPLSRGRFKEKQPGLPMLFVRLAASVFLPLLAMLASMLLAVEGHHPVLGVVFGVGAMALYGLRATYGQFRLLLAQWDLRSTNERLEMLSQRDPLTGLYNRRWFAEQFPVEWRRAQRGDQPISLLLLDVDHFKLYNDTRGHAEGDFCLQTIATLLVDQLSSLGDALVRWGGEEFVVMLPATDMDGMRTVARRMEDALAELRLPHPASPFGVVTVSIGGVTWFRPDGATNPDNLVMRADAALYEAKAMGRNRIHLVRVPASAA